MYLYVVHNYTDLISLKQLITVHHTLYIHTYWWYQTHANPKRKYSYNYCSNCSLFGQISALTFELDKFREEKDELQAALDMADSETTDLHKQKDLLIQLVEKISLQTLSLLNSVV